MAKPFSPTTVIAPHSHPRGQLVYSTVGVIRVTTEAGSWTASPLRGVWIPPAVDHETRMIGAVEMRTAYLREDLCDQLPARVSAVEVTPLLRELIIRASMAPFDYDPDSHTGKLIEAIPGEVRATDARPIHLRTPTDPRLLVVCRELEKNPDNSEDLEVWARRAGASSRTLHRLFCAETGISFVRWREHVRIRSAIERLDAGVPLEKVARQVGYSSASAFTAMFRRICGHPPCFRNTR
ncbi:AraC family transcriptional regulator [Bradyrhizobium centrolobii]|uniref:AraC family transcriptional regulator n=1 Tax=Bradyrhizobium centrolobii TaxID=1505087 RepID=UPI001FD958EA|nr:helix-turn-helix transcriptional regulator [Bradyrhizobium centrolobii]